MQSDAPRKWAFVEIEKAHVQVSVGNLYPHFVFVCAKLLRFHA